MREHIKDLYEKANNFEKFKVLIFTIPKQKRKWIRLMKEENWQLEEYKYFGERMAELHEVKKMCIDDLQKTRLYAAYWLIKMLIIWFVLVPGAFALLIAGLWFVISKII